MTVGLENIIRALSDPAIYPHGPSSVQVLQTHISVVFIADQLVYKLKKPVNMGFLDFSTLEKRVHYCLREVMLNSRFSHGIYLGVAPIFEDPAVGINLDGTGHQVDAAVVMRRIPEDCFMTSMLEKDLITAEILDRLADRLAYFHSLAARGPEISRFGDVALIYRNLKENFDQTAPFVGRVIDKETHEQISHLALDFLYRHEKVFRDRVARGFIRDCHGDLHLDHVLILDGIMFYDCIEFNDRFRFGDTASDLGFLLMDLDFWGFPAYAARISDRYAAYSGDEDVICLLGFYKSYRAFVRGKVSALALDEPEISQVDKTRHTNKAQDSFRLALAYFKPPPPPVLIAMTGLTGTGKSFLASLLGKRLGVNPLQSDVVRKRIHGLIPLQHQLDKFGEGVYTAKATERTYRALLEAARQALHRGESVVLDASFLRYEYREAARSTARAAGARFRLIQCTAPEALIHERLGVRLRRKDDPSDGRWEIYCEQQTQSDPLLTEEHVDLRVWDSRTDPSAFLVHVVRELTVS